jgi:hypothetical protein
LLSILLPLLQGGSHRRTSDLRKQVSITRVFVKMQNALVEPRHPDSGKFLLMPIEVLLVSLISGGVGEALNDA